jgi:hypothetical protein
MSAEQNQPDQPDPLAIFKGGVAAGMPGAAPQICPYPSMTKEAAEWRRGKQWGIDMANARGSRHHGAYGVEPVGGPGRG